MTGRRENTMQEKIIIRQTAKKIIIRSAHGRTTYDTAVWSLQEAINDYINYIVV